MMEQKVNRTELSPIAFLRRSAYMFPRKTAVVHGARRYTYAQLQERVDRFASSLRRAGLRKHDRVAFLAPNIPAVLEAHYAVPLAGGILVAINTRLSAGEIEHILHDSGARYLFVDAELHAVVDQLEVELQVVRIDDTGTSEDPYEAFLAAGSEQAVPSMLDDEQEPISINYTSGTTGQPKGVVYSHRGTYLNALGSVIEMGLSLETVFLWIVPMFHANGWCFTWAVTAVGGCHVCLRVVDVDTIWDVIDQEGVTHYNGAPTVHTMLATSPRAARRALPITVTVAGSPPSPTLIRQLRELNFRIVHAYGLTETYAPMTVCAWQQEWNELSFDDQARLQACQGQAYPTADLVRVVDENNRDIPRDGQTMGEVVMRGNNVMLGYFNDGEATSQAFRGGWFHSGDLAVWHPNGYVELRDRKKDIIISGGENISTIEVEQTVVKHPEVLECAVVAVPNEKWGERPKAFVSLKDGSDTSAADIIAFCRANLAHYKCPDTIQFGAIPKTSTGKVQKYVLREQEWQGHEKRIH